MIAKKMVHGLPKNTLSLITAELLSNSNRNCDLRDTKEKQID